MALPEKRENSEFDRNAPRHGCNGAVRNDCVALDQNAPSDTGHGVVRDDRLVAAHFVLFLRCGNNGTGCSAVSAVSKDFSSSLVSQFIQFMLGKWFSGQHTSRRRHGAWRQGGVS